MELFFLCLSLITSFLNLALLFFLGTYLVRMNDRFSSMMNDLVRVLVEQNSVIPEVQEENVVKTWDQKFEEEIDRINRRMRFDSGLSDISDGVSYNAPPAPNKAASEGLTIRDR